MKKILAFYLVAVGLLLSFQSCNEDLDLVGEFTETAVVYGLLDQGDSIHMIKITRAFIGPGNATQIAGIADSSYFESVEGTVTEYAGFDEVNGIPISPTGRVFKLLDTIVYNKEENGIFYAPEQKLYYFDNTKITATNTTGAALNENYYYQLDLDINNGEFAVSGVTELVREMTISPMGAQPYRFVGVSNDLITTTVTVNVNSGTARVINTTVNVEFSEWIGATESTKSFNWRLGENSVEQGGFSNFSAPGTAFYNLVAQNCTNDPNIDKRIMESMTTIVTGGTENLRTYMEVSEPSTSLAQSKVSFTNLTATNGHAVLGIFAARHKIEIYHPFYDLILGANFRCINKKSTEYLCLQSPTNQYFFCSDHQADINSGEAYVCN